jgi:hypothetical protein
MYMKIKFTLALTAFGFVSYAQNSGIGTDTPGSKLEIVAETCDDTKSAFNVKDNCSNSLLFMYNGGKVGIGTNSPSFKLSLSGTSAATQTIGINNIPVAYLLNQSTNVGSIAFGDGLRNSQTSGSTGLKNTATGIASLTALTSGNNNVANGYGSLNANTTGSSNAAFGANALNANTTGSGNVAVGFMALNANTIGLANSAVGQSALQLNTGDYNSAFGNQSLQSNTSGGSNTAVGVNTMKNNLSGSSNTALGMSALFNNTTGSENTAVGSGSLGANTTGQYNVALGNGALSRNTTAAGNIAIGYISAFNITTGSSNVAIGGRTLYNSTTAYNNIAIGNYAGENITTGGHNVIIGNFDGTASAGISTGNNNILIGKNVKYGIDMTASNQLNIGNLIFSKAIGGEDALPYWGRIGIKSSDPKSTLEVAGSVGYKVVSKAANYTAGEEAVILVDASSAVTIYLPPASDVNGRNYTIKKIAGSNDVTIVPGSDNIDGSSSNYILTNANQFVTLICDGDNWFVIGN